MVVGKPYIHFKVNNEPIEEVVDYNYTWATTVETNKGPINTPVYIENASQAKSIFNVNMHPYFAQNPQSLIMVRVAASTKENTPSQGVFNFNLAEPIKIFRAEQAVTNCWVKNTINTYENGETNEEAIKNEIPLYYTIVKVNGSEEIKPLIPYRNAQGKLIPETYIDVWNEFGYIVTAKDALKLDKNAGKTVKDLVAGTDYAKTYSSSVVKPFLYPHEYIIPVSEEKEDEETGSTYVEKTALFTVKSKYEGKYDTTVSCYKAITVNDDISLPSYTIAINDPYLGTLRIANGYDVKKIVNRINDRELDVIAETTNAGEALYNAMHSYPQPISSTEVAVPTWDYEQTEGKTEIDGKEYDARKCTFNNTTKTISIITSDASAGMYIAPCKYRKTINDAYELIPLSISVNESLQNEDSSLHTNYKIVDYCINLEEVGLEPLSGGNNGEWDEKTNRIPTKYQASAHKEGLEVLRKIRLAGIFCMYGEDDIQREYSEHGINTYEPEKGMNNNETCKWRTILLGVNKDDRSDLTSLIAKAKSLDDEHTLLLGQGLVDTGVLGESSNMTIRQKSNYGLISDHHLLPYECTQYIAGLRSKLFYGESIFGGQGRKRIRSIGDLEIAPLLDYETEYTWEPNYYTRLNEAGVLTFTEDYGNITLTDGVTTVQSGEEEDEEGVMNILKYAQNAVYDVCLPYIGRNIDVDLENSLVTSIEGVLEEMKSVDQTLIDTEEYSAYDVTVSLNSRKNQLLGRIYVYLTICPVHAIRQIEVEMTVQ